MMNNSIISDLSCGDQCDLSPDLSIYSSLNSPNSDYDSDDNSDSESSNFDFQSLKVFYTNADTSMMNYKCSLLAMNLT